jgi:hypothetical protein
VYVAEKNNERLGITNTPIKRLLGFACEAARNKVLEMTEEEVDSFRDIAHSGKLVVTISRREEKSS